MSFQWPEFGSNSLAEIFQAYPRRGLLMMELFVDVMDDTDELSALDKELIFAFTSYQNACHYCFESHKAVAQAHGLDADVFEQIVGDLENADIDARMKAVLIFVQKLSNSPTKIVESDLTALQSAGLSESAVVDVISVCALANYMNRFVDGLGVDTTEEQAQIAAPHVATGGGYAVAMEHLRAMCQATDD